MALSRVQWLTDFIRLEIALWEDIDALLNAEHGISLAFFEVLYFIEHSPDGGLKVGDLAKAMGITVGGCSKLADRVEVAGLIQREALIADRRASRLVLTATGHSTVEGASRSYEEKMANILDSAFSRVEQQQMHDWILRLMSITISKT